MNISEMHAWFRQYAQQMGMQNVRAILPEQIDNLINTSTLDTIDEIVNRNVGTTNDRIITDNSKLANVNALKTLYRVKSIPPIGTSTISDFKNIPYEFTSQSILEDALYFVDFSIRYITNEQSTTYTNAVNSYKNAIADYQEAWFDFNTKKDSTSSANFYAALTAVRNAETALRNARQSDSLTRWFPIRIIDEAYLADALNDWVLAPRMRTPVMVVYASPVSGQQITNFELYLGENDSDSMSSVASSYSIGEIRCSFIKTPAKVQYLSDINGSNVDSDLPEQLQIPMLKHAVDLYRISIQGSLYANQQNAQQNQQELARNNARPDNDGYQS